MSIDIHHYFGFYRAKVLENKDPEKFGRIKVWVPDIMPEIEPEIHPKELNDTVDGFNVTIDKGLWAYPANNPVGGRSGIENNDQWGQGTCYIPKLGSYVWVFFEGGNINRPWYFGSIDIETSKVLPENQAGKEYQNKWTIFKSSQGRTIVISDDCDERVEITGKKRKIKKNKEHPEGDIESVYEIDGNQTTILLEETEGNEKLLIKTWQGDFINIDISTRELHCYFKNNINIKSDSDILLEANNIHFTSNNDFFITSSNDLNLKATNTFITGDESLNLKSEMNTLIYGGEFVNILAESDLFLTGQETIHQYTSLNLIGGDVNIGLVVPRKAPAGAAAMAGDSGSAGKPKVYGERSTNESCVTTKHPDTSPEASIGSISPKTIEPPSTEEIPEEESSHNGLIPDGIGVGDVFDRSKYI